MSKAAIRFDTQRLLWRTRGAAWDYWFVLRPTTVTKFDWADAFDRVFPDSQAPRTGTEYRRGQLTGGGPSPLAFHAGALTDARHKDAAGRQVQHFFVYLDEAESTLDTADWGPGLLANLNPAYEVIFALARQPGESDQAFPERLQRTFLEHLPRELAVLAEPVIRPRHIDMGIISMQPQSLQAPAEPDLSSESEPLSAVSGPGILGFTGRGVLSFLGRVFAGSDPKEYKLKIAELVDQMAEREGPEATRRFLEQLHKELAFKR